MWLYNEKTGRRVAVITGAASGIGAAIARELVKWRVRAVLADLDPHVQNVAEELGQKYVVGDVRDERVQNAIIATAREFGEPATIFVPAAGVTKDSYSYSFDRKGQRWRSMPRKDFGFVMSINFLAPYFLAQKICAEIVQSLGYRDPAEGEEPKFKICFIGSICAAGNPGQANYSSAKAALVGLANTLQDEWSRYGGAIHVIHPTFTATGMTKNMKPGALEKGVELTVSKKLHQPEWVAAVVSALLNEQLPGVSPEAHQIFLGRLESDAHRHPPVYLTEEQIAAAVEMSEASAALPPIAEITHILQAAE